jgi:hypothetical protein
MYPYEYANIILFKPGELLETKKNLLPTRKETQFRDHGQLLE